MSEPTTAFRVPAFDTADRMRKALRESGVGVQEMAEYLDVSRNTVSSWINGRIAPSTQTLRLWSLRCGVDYTWLTTGASRDTNRYRVASVTELPRGHRSMGRSGHTGMVAPSRFRVAALRSLGVMQNVSGMTPNAPRQSPSVTAVAAVDLMPQWEMCLRADGASPNSIRLWTGTVRAAAARFAVAPQHLTADHIRAVLAAHPNGNTRDAYYRTFAKWSRWLNSENHASSDALVAGIRKPRQPRGVPHPVSTIALHEMLAAPLRAATRAQVLLGAFAGFRAHEIAKVRGEDLDVDARTIRVTGKGGVVAELPLHNHLIDHAALMPTDGWWFPSRVDPTRPVRPNAVTTSIANAMRGAGVKGAPHDLRHWFGTWLLRSGADVKTVQALMRHASLATTERYLELSGDECRAAVLRLSDVAGLPGRRASGGGGVSLPAGDGVSEVGRPNG